MLSFKMFLEAITKTAKVLRSYHDNGERHTGAIIDFWGIPSKDSTGKDIEKQPRIIPNYRLQKNETGKTILGMTGKDRESVHYFAKKGSKKPLYTTAIPKNRKKEQPWKTDLVIDGHHRLAGSNISKRPLKTIDLPRKDVKFYTKRNLSIDDLD